MRFFAFGVIRTMNILIVGNGFDLSHYLPTKYDHFMVAMQAIENWDEPKEDMGFDDLFGSLYEKEDYFFSYTKEIYKTDEIKISVEQINNLKKQLKENIWYQYFSDHVKEVKTWIDFELKIEDALNSICKFLNKVDVKFDELGNCNLPIYLLENGEKKAAENYYVSSLECENLIVLKLLNKNTNYGQHMDFWTDEKLADIESTWFHSHEKIEYGFSNGKYLMFLVSQLEAFIDLFNEYLQLVIRELVLNKSLEISFENWMNPNKIYSFNYTNTYQRIYDSVEVEYLHGSHGENQNIVLGISDLKEESLKKLKAYGFTKYHQKLFKDTDYLFLDEFKKKIISNRLEIERFEKNYNGSLSTKESHLKVLIEKGKLNLNISIWGHSLDYSDKDYITDLFSLNDDMDRNVRVIIYYFDKPAKFLLLNNLLAILGKDKVEHWMKNEWLVFKPNPEIKFGAIISEKTA